MITYNRNNQDWSFSPLPTSATTAKLFSSMAAIKKNPRNIDTISELLTALPECIGRSMRDHHTEDQVNAFIDTILLDFGNPSSLTVLGDLSQLFMGIDPAKTADLAVNNEQPGS